MVASSECFSPAATAATEDSATRLGLERRLGKGAGSECCLGLAGARRVGSADWLCDDDADGDSGDDDDDDNEELPIPSWPHPFHPHA